MYVFNQTSIHSVTVHRNQFWRVIVAPFPPSKGGLFVPTPTQHPLHHTKEVEIIHIRYWTTALRLLLSTVLALLNVTFRVAVVGTNEHGNGGRILQVLKYGSLHIQRHHLPRHQHHHRHTHSHTHQRVSKWWALKMQQIASLLSSPPPTKPK